MKLESKIAIEEMAQVLTANLQGIEKLAAENEQLKLALVRSSEDLSKAREHLAAAQAEASSQQLHPLEIEEAIAAALEKTGERFDRDLFAKHFVEALG